MTSHRAEQDQLSPSRAPLPLLPLDSARESFALLVAGPRPLSLNGQSVPGLPNRRIPLDEVRDRMMRRRCPGRTRDAVWAHLVRRSRREGATWTVACAGMALPALSGVARWLGARFPGDLFDVHAEVLTGFLDGLASVDLNRPHVLPRLRWAAYRQGYAALTEALDAPMPLVVGFRSTPPSAPWGHPDLVLAKAVRAGVLTTTEADLIGATRLEEEPVADWAVRQRMMPAAAYKARRRAETRLVDFLRDEARDADPDDPVAALAFDQLPSRRGPYPQHHVAVVPEDPSPPVTAIRDNSAGEPAEEVGAGVSKIGPESGLWGCGSTSPVTSSPSSEESQCA